MLKIAVKTSPFARKLERDGWLAGLLLLLAADATAGSEPGMLLSLSLTPV